jgi:CRISPR/Cas system-associated exonuclease Cas4 (RecB family)
MRENVITASEVSEFLYCQRAWWYRLHGLMSAAATRLEQGSTEHEVLAEAVEQVEQSHRWAWRLIVIGAILFIVVLIVRGLMG